jgi:TonB family protein
MPLALLLSPDDQAVSAITAVLEEMLVTWERPLDGVSAAKKLNSHSFDLVLVDCENLPAAKLIFDVCRRGKGGNNPVPIAIVDGRAGLPTAFRLGAELILTKPVAKDQARSTIRTAVSRVKKEEPDRYSPAANELSAVHEEALQPAADHANHEASLQHAGEAIPQERALASAAAAASSSHLTSLTEPASAATLTAPALTATVSATATAPEINTPGTVEAPPVVAEPKPSAPLTPAADSSFAQSEKPDAKAGVEPVLASVPQSEKEARQDELSHNEPSQNEADQSKQGHKTRGPLVGVVMLVLVGAGLYAAWTYEPGFKTLAQPLIDRVRTQTPGKPAAEAAKAPATSPDSVPSSQLPGTNANAAAIAVTPSRATSASPPAPTPVSASPSSGTPASGDSSTADDAATSAPAKSGLNKIDIGKTDAIQKSSTQTALHPSTAENNQNVASAAQSDAELTGKKTVIVLSSKGAGKRLVYSVQPTYPASVRPADVQGTLVLRAVVDENGNVAGARVIEGNAALANAAISAVKQWRYRPYVRDGRPLPFQTIVLVDFERP